MLRAIKERYKVSKGFREGYEKYFFLFSKTEEGRYFPMRYLCSILEVDDGYSVEGMPPVKTTKAVEADIQTYLSGLRFHSDSYFPQWNYSARRSTMMQQHMDKIGFHYEWGYNKQTGWFPKDKSIYNYRMTDVHLTLFGIDHMNYFGGKPDYIQCVLHTGKGQWVETEPVFMKGTVLEQVEEMCDRIDSLLKPLLLTEALRNADLSERMNFNGSFEILMREVRKTPVDLRAGMKEKLLAMAAEL